MSEWNRKTHPYRATWLSQASRALNGWRSLSKTYETEAEAITAMEARFNRGTYQCTVDVAVDTPHHFRWKKLRERKLGGSTATGGAK